ncbi:MAG TPA: aldo/keto reductase [Gemmatimonas sp.]|nr:aldo/keto reductase [Gemmatimonas sp.]
MANRQRLLGVSAVAGAALAISAQLLGAQQLNGKLIQRAIPSSGEMLPVIGLAFSNHPSCSDKAALTDVVKTFAANGGKYFDNTLGNGANQQFHINAANELGVTSKVFWSTPGFLSGSNAGRAGVKTQLDSTLARLKVPRIDVAWVNAAADTALLAALKEEKKAGRIRYIGALTIVAKNQSAQLEALMRNESLDFIGVDYDIGNRHVEETILPLARERKIAVIAYFPFGNNYGASCSSGGNLFARVGNRPVPTWAAEFDAKTWAQFFAKYVLADPAVTVARVGTSKVTHMLDNMAGGVGRLPNAAARKRMAALIDSLPKPTPPAPPPNSPAAPGIALSTAVLDRYVGEWKLASGTVVSFRRDGDKLIVKAGNNPELPLNARTETRLQDPRGPMFEWQVDAQGNVTGLMLEQGNPLQRIPLQRNR